MKKIITFLFLLNAFNSFSQIYCENYCLNFEDSICPNKLTIDTTVSFRNLWQIGRPHKLILDSSSCVSTVIITDTVNPYPVNNYSFFIIRNQVSMGDIYGLTMFEGNYYVQTDSLKDYGKIEFSHDNGITWIDIINDTVYDKSFVWYSPKPVLTGHSRVCKHFDVLFADLGSVFNINYGDTLLFRFSFFSDSIYDNLGGLMFDNLCFNEFIEGISKTRFKPIKSNIYPNPSTNIFTIDFENPTFEQFELSIYDIYSKLVLKKDYITESKIVIEAKYFKPGTYIYKITNLKAQKRCWGKFITTKLD